MINRKNGSIKSAMPGLFFLVVMLAKHWAIIAPALTMCYPHHGQHDSLPLKVYDFPKAQQPYSSLAAMGAEKLGKIASILANGEGLQAYAISAEYRHKIDKLRDDA